MGYGEIWKILSDLIIEFRKRRELISPNVIEDLRAAKTMIEVLKADPTRAENIPSIEMYLGNVETYLIFTAHKKFGAEFAESWMQKLHEARKTIRIEEKEKPSSKFVPRVPRDQKWLRVQVSAETPEEEIKKLAAEFRLSTKIQTDGYMLIYGDGEKLKLFVQKTGEKFRRRKGL